MNAIIVAVDYLDVLSLTLPYNRHHFDSVMVVTSLKPSDDETVGLCRYYGVGVHRTSAFYEGGADFNKFKALEEGLDLLGRYGVIAILDADIVWPKELTAWRNEIEQDCYGLLYTPRRRVIPTIPQEIPPEDSWSSYPDPQRHKEFVGYTQVFHADDPVLGSAPWHPTDWRHAGGGDSAFQAKWPEERKVRPPFEVLHLGPIGTNWCGKTGEAKQKLDRYMKDRIRLRSTRHERL